MSLLDRPTQRRKIAFMLTPLVDVMFLLLIFFMLSSQTAPYSLLTISVPDTGAPAAPAAPTVRPVAPRASRSAVKRVPTSLAVTQGSLAGTTLSLMDSGVLLGRNPECTLVLDDDFASGRHARVFRRGDGWFVEDLGSTNGTFLGSRKLTEPTPVEVGSALRIGKTIFELRK